MALSAQWRRLYHIF